MDELSLNANSSGMNAEKCREKNVAWTYSSASDIDSIRVLRIFNDLC